MAASDPTPRLLAIFRPLKLTILNWQGDEEQWLEGPCNVPGQRRIPWGKEVFLETRDFVNEALVTPNGDQVAAQLAGTNVRLRHSYVVCFESFRQDDIGNVIEILGRCNYDSLGVPTALDGVGQIPKVVSWVHASSKLHLQVPLVEGPANFVATYWPQGKSGSVPESIESISMLCEPWLTTWVPASGYTDSSHAEAAGAVQLERLGKFRICPFQGANVGNRDGPKYALQCLAAWLPKFCTPPKPGKRQRVPEAVLAAAAAEAAARKEAMHRASLEFSLEEPLLMACACDRWERVLALDLQEAWRGTNASVVEIAPALFRLRGHVPSCLPGTVDTTYGSPDSEPSRVLPQGTFERTCVWHTAGVRRCLQLLTIPSPPAPLIEAVSLSKLSFPDGWSLEHESPYPVRYESLAPYTQSSGFLAAGLGRSISGPMVQAQGDNREDKSGHEVARLVTVEMINSEGLHFLARDLLADRHGFNPASFGSIWRSRPYPDYSAALEPLAALALLGIGLRVHHRLTGRDPRAFLDATCGTGTVAAAAKYCVSTWQIFAGDVNPTMSKRSLVNLMAAFPGQAYELLDEPSSSDPFPGIGVRQWDATNLWPIPARHAAGGADGLGKGGEGLLVASNLPWGKSLDTQVEAATLVAQCLAQTLPRATLCLIAPEEVGRNCSDWFHLLHSAPVGKKAVLIVGHGIACEEKRQLGRICSVSALKRFEWVS